MEKKSYRPKKGREGVRVSISLPDRAEQFVVNSWPHETEDAGEQAALDRHPFITDRPDQAKKSGGEGK